MKKALHIIGIFTLILASISSRSQTPVTSGGDFRFRSYFDVSDSKAYYLVWNIETGKSNQYYWDKSSTSWKSFEINLPERPLASVAGNVMMNVYYDFKDKKAYYIVWDTKGGKSVQYYWSNSDSKWEAMEINLPAVPLPGAIGDIMIDAYYDGDDADAYYLVYDTKTGKSIQYYWNSSDTKWEPMEINLPAIPLK